MKDRTAGLTPGFYLVSNAGTVDEETIRVTSGEFRAVLARGLAREAHGLPKDYCMADLRRGMVARVDESGDLVVERKGTHHEQPRRDRYATYSL